MIDVVLRRAFRRRADSSERADVSEASPRSERLVCATSC